jgi:hypothetical protein
MLEEVDSYQLASNSFHIEDDCNIFSPIEGKDEDFGNIMLSNSPDIMPRGSNSNQEKHSLEHSNSNSSTESAASSVDSNSTVSSDGSGCGSDGNSNGSHLPLCRKTETGMFPRISAKLIRAQEFGLSPPSESKLMQRRYREGNNGNPITGKKVNHSSLHALVTHMANEY